MFDDQQKPNLVTPNNLPSEPDDMFAGTPLDEGVPATDVSNPNSALGAGILRPKAAPAPIVPPLDDANTAVSQRPQPTQYRAMPADMMAANDVSGPESEEKSGRGWLTLILVLVVLAIVGIGGAIIYFKFIRTPAPAPAPVVPIETTTNPIVTPPVKTAPETAPATSTADDRILFGGTVDTDGDGLPDDEEARTYRTDPLNWDTDGDGLSDGDEVLIWKTNPLKADTDGDGYTDGQEIKNGYNPLGPGKLFNPGATTSTVSVASSTVSASTTTVVTPTLSTTSTKPTATTSTAITTTSTMKNTSSTPASSGVPKK